MKKIIEIEHLCKSFGDVKAVNDISFTVNEGELFAFLGVNGAGKSTSISMMCGQLKKDLGKILINGMDTSTKMDDIKRSIGVVFQNSVSDNQLSVIENLRNRASLYGIKGVEFQKRLDELTEFLSLSEIMKRPIGKLSGGQRRRVDIARAIFHKPRILILDEPTTGLDPKTRKSVWEVVDSLRKNDGMTVLLTTHYMEEAADAEHVVILEKGQIVAEGTPLELKNKYTGDFITIYNTSEESVKLLGKPYEQIGDGFRISVQDTAQATELIIKHPEIFNDYEIIKGRMDDVFLAVTNRKTKGGSANA